MKCLILAAGHGSRLREISDSKPLTPVAGVPLIEHVVGSAAAAGASEFVVVTGHQAERVEAFLAQLAARLGVPISCVRTPDWDRPNGFSLLTGADAIDGDYLLLMSDHLFDPQIPRRLVGAAIGGGVNLVVDRDLSNPLLDLEDATKVEVGPAGEIVRIGKALTGYNAIDTGIFLATPALAAAIREDVGAGGGGSLSEGVQRLADQRRAHTVDTGGRRWIDVDDPRGLQLAEAWANAEASAFRGNAA